MKLPPTAALRELLARPHGTDTSFVALCPAHEDHRRSLSVSRGRDGRALLKCHAGCDTAEVLAALGWSWSDTFLDPHDTAEVRW